MKRKHFLIVLLAALVLLAGCSKQGDTNAPATDGANKLDDTVTRISLSDSGITVEGGGAKAQGSTVTIGAVGTYAVSGALSDGQILIDTGDEAVKVSLILDGVDITNLSGPAIYIRQAQDARITLAEGSSNKVTSGTEADMSAHSADSSGAAIYAEDDLDIEGPGALEVRGYINNGIATKDDLDIHSGTITVLAANNGIRGAKSVEIKGGEVTVTAGNDGVKSSSAKKEGKGFITVSGGTLTVAAEGDGISAETELTVEDGVITVITTGDPDLGSCKALKAQTGITVSGGTLELSAPDHAIHSAAGVVINGGQLSAASTGGKAIAAHGDILIAGGALSVSAQGDGIETPGNVTVTGGDVQIIAGDDGVQTGVANSGVGTVTVSGGQVKISASGKSVNARGELLLRGGAVIALSGSDKAVLPSAGGQSYVNAAYKGAGGDTVSLSAGGEEPISLTASWPYKFALISTPELEAGASYTLSCGIGSVSAIAE